MSERRETNQVKTYTSDLAMASPTLFQYSSFFIFITSLVIPISCDAMSPHSKEHIPLFVFGDSLFDPGNNDYINTSDGNRANFPPYGETFFKYPTGRFSDGRLVPDFIAEYAKLPLWIPYLQPGYQQFTLGANFASAGAGVLVSSTSETIPLGTQLSYFKKVVNLLGHELGDVEAKILLMRAVYFFSIGGGDYFALSESNPSPTEQIQYVGWVIGNLSHVIQEIYDIGRRKFGFQNVGPLGCTPLSRAQDSNGDCDPLTLTLAKLHNSALSKAIKKLENKLHGFKYSIFDYYSTLSQRINHPTKYGFKDGKSACCGSGAYRGSTSCGGREGEEYELCRNPSEHVWYDFGHTSEHCNWQLAQLIWKGPPNVTRPYNLKQLFEIPNFTSYL